jgi:Protein of unknown function (DUF1579)
MLSGILALALLGAPAAVAAPTTPAPAPAPAPKRTPGCAEPESHLLDFWVGDWDTFDPDGPPGESQARAHVDSILVGCAVHELYEQTDGLIGDSFLSYDKFAKHWQQTWITNFGGFMFLTGNFKDGVLTLEGTYHTKTKDLPHKITWKQEKGGVRETGMMSPDGGKTWTLAFDVLFLKHKEKA